jgi:hypothetical protein
LLGNTKELVMPSWRTIRQNAGVSLQKASSDANVTTTTGRVFEIGGPDAISDARKRADCVAVWTSFADAPLSQIPPRSAA